MITDYHVHLETGPYTMDWLEEYVRVAKERGITHLGFSEHAYRFEQSKDILLNPWIQERQNQDIEDYINLVQDSKRKGYPVKLGVELDFVPGKEKEIERFIKDYPWDYVIGSVHWLGDWGFDLTEMAEGWRGKNIIDVYGNYFSIIRELLQFGQFDILGHLDVIKVLGHRPEERDQGKLEELYIELVKVIKESGMVVELSTAGLRKPVGEIYPSDSLLGKLAARDIPMIINSDAHHPEHIGFGYDQGIEKLRSHGIHHIYIFDRRKRTRVPLG